MPEQTSFSFMPPKPKRKVRKRTVSIKAAKFIVDFPILQGYLLQKKLGRNLPENLKTYLEFLEALEKPMLKKGIDITKIGSLIGKGTQGFAFKYGSNKVLKLTKDETEAMSSAILIRNSSEYVCKIFNVFVFPREMVQSSTKTTYKLINYDASKYSMAWILQEYLPGKVGEEFDNFLGSIRYGEISDFMYRNMMDEEEFIEEVKQKIRDDMNKEYWKDLDRIVDGLVDLKDKGIKFHDLFGKNLGRDSSGNIKMLDIGYSESKESVPPEEIKLERLLRQIK